MAQPKIYVGLEIGTTKTCMVVAEVYPDAKATIIGIGKVPSSKVVKGEIVDETDVRKCVTDAWLQAQDHANVDICSVILAVTGEHMKGDNRTGLYRLPDGEFEVQEKHLREARASAFKTNLSAERMVTDRVMGPFILDDKESTYHPVGLTAQTLKFNIHEMHGIQTRLQNSLHCVRNIPLEVDSMVFSPYATAQVILSRQQKDAGALVIDIGGGTTDFICFYDGHVVASGCVPVGGNTINQDIIKVSKLPVSNAAAEKFKCLYGHAFANVEDKSEIVYQSENGLQEVRMKRGDLNRIICERLYETLNLVKKRIPEQALANPHMAVYLSGGTSVMAGLDELAQRVFNRPVYQPELPSEDDQYSYLRDPRYCTAIGLIRYAQLFEEDEELQRPRSFWARLKGLFGGKR